MSIRLKAACILAFAPPCLYGIAQLYSRSPEPGTVVVSGSVSLPPGLVAIDAGVSDTTSLTIVNDGSQVIRPQLHASCSCISAELIPRRLAAGERATLLIKYVPNGAKGIFKKTVVISDSAGQLISVVEVWVRVPGLWSEASTIPLVACNEVGDSAAEVVAFSTELDCDNMCFEATSSPSTNRRLPKSRL